jgi:hypothetical protein
MVGLLMVGGLGIYFLLELYRPFEPRTSAPKNLELEYSGPGAIKSQGVASPPSTEQAPENPEKLDAP